MDVLSFLVGVSLTLTFAVVGAATYVGYRYVFMPWKLLRADQRVLIERLEESLASLSRRLDTEHEWVKHELGLRGSPQFTDAELAVQEAKARVRGSWGLYGGIGGQNLGGLGGS